MTYSPALRSHLVWGEFPYTAIPDAVPESVMLAYRNRARMRAGAMANAWTPASQSEWLVRNYLSAKLILAGSLKFASEEYADTHRLHVVRPYLIYYGLFHACR